MADHDFQVEDPSKFKKDVWDEELLEKDVKHVGTDLDVYRKRYRAPDDSPREPVE